MNIQSIRVWIRQHEAFALVAVAVAIAASLFSFEARTGLPASVRGAQTYNTLTLPTLRPAARKPAKKASLRDVRKARRTSGASSRGSQ